MFSRFQHLERWRFQPYADREDPFKRTYLTRDKLIWRWYCSRIEPPQFCSFWGGERPVRGPTDKVEQGKCLCERWVSVKAGTGRRSLLTSEGKDFPKPLCKTTADPAADSGTQAAAACSAARPALKTHWLPPPPPLFLSLLMYHPRGQDYEAPEKLASGRKSRSGYHLADTICLECGNALLYVNRHVCDVRYNNGQTGRLFLPTAPSITTWEQVLNCWHGDTSHCVIDIVHANRPRLTRPRFALMTFHDALCQHRASRRHV